MEEKNTASVLIMAYSRSGMVKDLLDSIPLHRPLYIFLDGPTSSNANKIAETKRVIQEFIALPNRSEQEIHVQFQKRNLGPKMAFTNAISWAFKDSETLIILEEDVRFSSQFFPFMDFCLEEFKNNHRIGQINGFSPVNVPFLKNYLFETQNAFCWGWATWKDRWSDYEVNIADNVDSVTETKSLARFKIGDGYSNLWRERISRVRSGFDTWDFQWNLSLLSRGSFAISPPFSLVTNIGIGVDATNTKTTKFFILEPSQLSEKRLNWTKLKLKRFPSLFNTLSDFIQFKTISVTPKSWAPLMLSYNFLVALRKFIRSK